MNMTISVLLLNDVLLSIRNSELRGPFSID